MTHAIVKAVSAMVYEGSIDEAERALVNVAEEQGDRALALVIEEMPARDLVAILREHDSARGSIVGELISPEQFIAAISLETQYREKRHESLKGMINAVVFRNEDETDTFIESLGGTQAGVNALVDYFSDRHEEVEYFFRNGTFDEGDGTDFSDIPATADDLSWGELDAQTRRSLVTLEEIRDHDWKELAWRLRVQHYEIFREVLEILRRRRAETLEAAAAAARAAETAAADQVDQEDDVL
jgi:hypothetical protein